MLRVRDLMTPDVATLSPEMSVREAMEELVRINVSGAPVVSGSSIVGVVTATDLLTFAASVRGVPSRREPEINSSELTETEHDGIEAGVIPDADDDSSSAFFLDLWDDSGAELSTRFDTSDAPEWNALEDHDVSEVMTTDLITVRPDDDARHAADVMRDRGIHRVLVVEGGTLVGILSSLDIARGVADRRFQTRTVVFDRER